MGPSRKAGHKEEHPAVDPTPVLEDGGIRDGAGVDAGVITGGDPSPPPRAPARPPVDTLFLYDSRPAEFLAWEAVQRVRYPRATTVGVSSFSELTAAISRYGQIGRLVICAHGNMDGRFALGEGRPPPAADVRDAFRASRTTVTAAIIFESCAVMADPVEVAYVVQDIASPGCVAIGYNMFLIANIVTGTLSHAPSVDWLRTNYFDGYEDYTPSGPGQSIADLVAQAPGVVSILRECFSHRGVYHVIGPRSRGDTIDATSVPRRFMIPVSVDTVAEAQRIHLGGSGGSRTWHIVTVTDIPTVAAGMTAP